MKSVVLPKILSLCVWVLVKITALPIWMHISNCAENLDQVLSNSKTSVRVLYL